MALATEAEDKLEAIVGSFDLNCALGRFLFGISLSHKTSCLEHLF
jgi:hypothetical protein